MSGSSFKSSFGVGFCFKVIESMLINKLLISGIKKNGDITIVVIIRGIFPEVKNPNKPVSARVIPHTATIKYNSLIVVPFLYVKITLLLI